MPLNTGMLALGGLAEGLKSGLLSYQDTRRYNDEKAQRDKMYRFGLLKEGYQESPEGEFGLTEEESNKRRLAEKLNLYKALPDDVKEGSAFGRGLLTDAMGAQAMGPRGLVGQDASVASPQRLVGQGVSGTAAQGLMGQNPMQLDAGYVTKKQRGIQDYVDKVVAAEMAKNKVTLKNSGQETDLDAAKKLTESVTNKITIAQQIDSYLSGWDQMSDEDKLVRGRQMIKILNSSEGKDAVGAEEAKRLASRLEFSLGNFFNDNPTQFGRDLPGFKRQASGVSNSMRGAARATQKTAEGITGTKSKLVIPPEEVEPGKWSESDEKRLKELEAKAAKRGK